MPVIVTILKVFILLIAGAGLVGGGLCSLCSVVGMLEDPGGGMQILVVSLTFALPSFFVLRAVIGSFNREAAAGRAALPASRDASAASAGDERSPQ